MSCASLRGGSRILKRGFLLTHTHAPQTAPTLINHTHQCMVKKQSKVHAHCASIIITHKLPVVRHSHAPSAGKSEGYGDCYTYQFSWNAISHLVVKLGSCRYLVAGSMASWNIPTLGGQQLLYSSPLLPLLLHLCITTPVLCQPLPVVVIWYALIG